MSLFPKLETLNGIMVKEQSQQIPNSEQKSHAQIEIYSKQAKPESVYKIRRNYGASQSIDSAGSSRSLD